MTATPTISNRDSNVREVTSSAMSTLTGAKRKPEGSEGIEVTLEMLRASESQSNAQFTRWQHPGDANDKENCISGSNQLKASPTPTKVKPLNLDDNAESKINSFEQSLKEMMYASRKKQSTPKKVRTGGVGGVNKGSGTKSLAVGATERVKIGKEVNTEEDILFEVRAKPFRLSTCVKEQPSFEGANHVWTKSSAGSLKLYRHKTTRKTRLVQRNAIGTVKLNVAIVEGINCLDMVRVEAKRKGRKPKDVAYVRFFAVADEDTGLECFLLKVKPENLDPIYTKLKEMGAKTTDTKTEEAK